MRSSRPNQPPMALPTNAELDILAVIWRLGMATVREVHDELDKDNRYTTTLKTIQLMTEKGLLTRGERFGCARLPGRRAARANPATDRGRPPEEGLRRFRPQPGIGCSHGIAGLAPGTRRNPRNAGRLCQEERRVKMNTIQILSSEVWVERLGWTLVHFLWQGLAIALLYAAADRVMARRYSPNGRYLLACAALVAMMAAPLTLGS